MDAHRRGARVAGSARRWLNLPWMADAWCRLRGRLRLAGIAVAALDETKHFKLIGTTGTGKSTAIRQLLGEALARGDRAIVADPEGGYLQFLGDTCRGDVVLNPFERRSRRWDPFGEVDTAYDLDQLAAGLIPAGADVSANEWRSYARTFLVAILRRCRQRNCCDPQELWRLLSSAPVPELRRLVAGTAAQPFLDTDNARMFSSIRSVGTSAAAALEYIAQQRGAGFSVRRWVRQGSGSLFIPYQAGQIAALRGIIAAWVRLAIIETMSGNTTQKRVWFVVDELDALGAIDGLKDALARLRKFGGRCILGFQSIAQVSDTYGNGAAQTIVENCGNTLILRCSGSEQGGTSQFASRLIGDREVLRRQTSRGRDRGTLFNPQAPRRSSSTNTQYVTETAVMASEIEQLADLCGYLKTASSAVWRRVRIAR
jgi:type IV secretory pathway TraG/TraD family ATPase VirD4